MKILKEYGPYLTILLVVVLLKIYIMTPIAVNGDSMYPTLKNNDIMLLDKSNKKINRFDIVVIRYGDKYLIKRVIGLPGETVKFEDNVLYINGKEYEQDFLEENVVTKDFDLKGKIPKDFYFVMGDNRGVSLDSRMLGSFSIDKIDGKANFTIFPFNRLGNKK